MKEFLQHSADQIEELQTDLKNKDQVRSWTYSVSTG
jgi:hypothetical protein